MATFILSNFEHLGMATIFIFFNQIFLRQIRSSSKSNHSNQSHSETQEHSSQRDSRGDTRRDHRHHSAHHEDSRTHHHRHQSSSRSSQDHHDYERSKYKYVRKQLVSQQCKTVDFRDLSCEFQTSSIQS